MIQRHYIEGLGSHVTGVIHNNKGEISLASYRYLGVPDLAHPKEDSIMFYGKSTSLFPTSSVTFLLILRFGS